MMFQRAAQSSRRPRPKIHDLLKELFSDDLQAAEAREQLSSVDATAAVPSAQATMPSAQRSVRDLLFGPVGESF